MSDKEVMERKMLNMELEIAKALGVVDPGAEIGIKEKRIFGVFKRRSIVVVG